MSEKEEKFRPMLHMVSLNLPADKAGDGRCYHRLKGYKYDEDAQRIYCKACDAEVSAWNAFIDLVSGWKHYRWKVDDGRRKLASLESKVADLQREERNIKARLKNAHKRERVENPERVISTLEARVKKLEGLLAEFKKENWALTVQLIEAKETP